MQLTRGWSLPGTSSRVLLLSVYPCLILKQAPAIDCIVVPYCFIWIESLHLLTGLRRIKFNVVVDMVGWGLRVQFCYLFF